MIDVMVVDDQDLIRGGLVSLLSAQPGIEVVAEAADGEAAVAAALDHRPDVILMDIEMERVDGIEATRRIVAATDCKVVILTTFNREDYLREALLAGAAGFVLKNSRSEALVAAIDSANQGYALVAPAMTLRLVGGRAEPLQHGADHDGTPLSSADIDPLVVAELTPREIEILGLIAAGLSNNEIADRLVIGESTVKTHVSSLLTKLDLRDRVQAVIFAFRHRLVADPPRD